MSRYIARRESTSQFRRTEFAKVINLAVLEIEALSYTNFILFTFVVRLSSFLLESFIPR